MSALASHTSMGTLEASHQTSKCGASVSRRLAALQLKMMAAAKNGPVRQDTVRSWAAELEHLRSAAASDTSSTTFSPINEACPVSDVAALQPPRRPPTHLHVPDRGQLEERQVVPRPSTATTTATRNLSLCIVTVLESLLNTTHIDAVSLVVPHRGMNDELRCLCRLSRGSDRLFGGSGVLRGTNTLEYSCLTTGMVLNMGPKALLGEADSGSGCTSFLELLHEGRSHARATTSAPASASSCVPAPSSSATGCARLCCPIRRCSSAPAVGVLTAISSRRRFDEDDENLFFDSATILSPLLARCTDYAVLQATFSRGGLLQLLPPHNAHVESAVMEPRQQLIYRVDADPSKSPQSLRIPCDGSGTVKLREGTPVESLFSHMQRLQNSWLSAVKLNVELKRVCDEKEEYINALVSRSKAERIAVKGQSPTERTTAASPLS